MKLCRDCGRTLPAEQFWRRAASPDGLALYCKECFSRRNNASSNRRRTTAGLPPLPHRRREQAPEGAKRCPDCGEVKDLSEFPRNRSEETGYGTYCKPCHNVRGRANCDKNHGSTRNYHLKRRYGIDQTDFERILRYQDGKCAACGKPDPEHVDHDHATGEVRGVLCFNCNQALGNVRDDARVLTRLIDYLDRSRETPLQQRLARAEVAERFGLFITELPADVEIHYAGTAHASRP